MTEPVQPQPAPNVPLYPALGSASFNQEAYEYGSSMRPVALAIRELANVAYTNALAANERAGTAGTHAANAAGEAGRAALRAGEASGSAQAAAGHASNAATAATSAHSALGTMQELYLGAKYAHPVTDNLGRPLAVGATYNNRTDGAGYWWDGTRWLKGYGNPATVDWTSQVTGKPTTVATSGLTDAVSRDVGALRDKTQLMANAPIGQPAAYSSGTGAGTDWPTDLSVCCWIVDTQGTATRCVQTAAQVLNVSGQQGWTFIRFKHDSTWSSWARIITDGTVIERTLNTTITTSSYTANPADATLQYLGLGANTTISASAPRTSGDQLTLRIYQGGSWSLAFAANIKPPIGASPPALSPGQWLTVALLPDTTVAGGWVLSYGSKH